MISQCTQNRMNRKFFPQEVSVLSFWKLRQWLMTRLFLAWHVQISKSRHLPIILWGPTYFLKVKYQLSLINHTKLQTKTEENRIQCWWRNRPRFHSVNNSGKELLKPYSNNKIIFSAVGQLRLFLKYQICHLNRPKLTGGLALRDVPPYSTVDEKCLYQQWNWQICPLGPPPNARESDAQFV